MKCVNILRSSTPPKMRSDRPLRRPQQFEDSIFLLHISRTWTLAKALEPATKQTSTEIRDPKRKPQNSPSGYSKIAGIWAQLHCVTLSNISRSIYDAKNPRNVFVLSKARALLNLWIFSLLTILAPATHCWCLPSHSRCPQGTESTRWWHRRLSL